jgi:hypothetical protein
MRHDTLGHDEGGREKIIVCGSSVHAVYSQMGTQSLGHDEWEQDKSFMAGSIVHVGPIVFSTALRARPCPPSHRLSPIPFPDRPLLLPDRLQSHCSEDIPNFLMIPHDRWHF